MSLVAYDYSDSEEEEAQDRDAQKNGKVKQPVKISIPAVSYDSDDEPASKKLKTKDNRCGLLSLLPPPKQQPAKVLTLVPNILNRKSTVTTPKNNSNTTKVASNKDAAVKPTNDNVDSDSDESISEDEVVPNFDEELWKKVIAPRKKKFHSDSSSKLQETNGNEAATAQEVQIAPEPVKPYEGLDNAAFKELVGKSRKKQENINIIDIHEDEIHPDKEEWLKSLTDPNYAPKTAVEDPVNDTCKRKHHITYLAQQAKANELELQNQWAQNRFARKQTQAKYGF